jgi:hypothetical protein
MKYTRLFVVLIGSGTFAPALGQPTWVGLLAWVLAATLPSTPTRLTAYVVPVGRVTSTTKLPVTVGGGGDSIGEALGETSGEADGVGSKDAVAEGLAGGVGDAFAWDPFPPPQPDRRTATVSSNVESLMPRIINLNATLRMELRFRYHPAPEAGHPLTPRAPARKGPE